MRSPGRQRHLLLRLLLRRELELHYRRRLLPNHLRWPRLQSDDDVFYLFLQKQKIEPHSQLHVRARSPGRQRHLLLLRERKRLLRLQELERLLELELWLLPEKLLLLLKQELLLQLMLILKLQQLLLTFKLLLLQQQLKLLLQLILNLLLLKAPRS